MPRSEQESYAQNRSRMQQLEQRKERIRQLNDDFRFSLVGGRCVITAGIQALGVLAIHAILGRIRAFDSFDEGNDPYQEHDFGSIEYAGSTILWKIDCYDKRMEFGSPDPADVDVTARVLTIMLAREY